MKKCMQWVLAAALMISGLGALTSCEKFEEANQDVLCQWINIFAEEGIDLETGLPYNQVAEVMEFFENGTGYYECYLLNDDELVCAEYVRGKNGNFRYEVEGGLDLRSTVAQKNPHVRLDITMFLLSEFYYWTVRYEDGVITDGNYVYTPATAAQQAQIRQWYESSRSAEGIAMIVKARDIDYWRQIETSFRGACQKKGLKAFYYGTSGDMDYEEQLAAVEAISKLDDKLLGIIYTPSYGPNGENADAAVAALAAERGIPVIILDSEIKDDSPLAHCPYFGTDNAGAGLAMAEKVAAEKVAVFAMQTSPGMVRAEAFKTLKPGADIFSVSDYAEDEVKAVIDDYDNFVFFNGNVLVDVLDLLKEKGKNVYTFDVYGEFLDELIAGNPSFKGIMAQNTFGMAEKAVEAVLSQAEQGEMVPTFYIDGFNLDAPEVQPFLDFYGKQLPVIEGLSEKIIGKWMQAESDGEPMLTNKKTVTTFYSSTLATVSTSREIRNATTVWSNSREFEVKIEGNKVTLTSQQDESTTLVNEYIVTEINDSEMICNFRHSTIRNGEQRGRPMEIVRYVKVTANHTADIIGTWEGHCTSEGSVFDDGQEHRWEYKADGTYVYYVKDGDSWVTYEGNTLNEYFVDGTLLCTRWIDLGQENREWWEITIADGKMNWTALRQNPDGTTFTATFSMTKVQ